MVLPSAKPSELAGLAQREAMGDVPLLQQTEVISGIHLGASRGFSTTAARREVVFAAASAPDIRSRIQPLIEAGFVIETVATPPLALCSIARLRRGTVPGAALALFALGSTGSALAIVRDGLLLLAREMPWGYEGLVREALVTKLVAELRRSFLFFKQSNRAEIAQVVLCGDAPELRALTAPLIMALDLEVETLDSLAGIDAASLPELADVFRERVANFRLAWALAADAKPPINLIPVEIAARRHSTRPTIPLIGSGAVAVILGLIGYAYLSQMTRPTSHPSAGAAPGAPPSHPSAPEQSTNAPKPPAAPAPNSSSAQSSGSPALPPDVDDSDPAPLTPNPSASARPPGASTEPRIEEPAAPVVADHVVQSILYSAERRAALVDNRVVGVGDQLKAGRVVEIERDAVVIETPRGERHRLLLRGARPSGELRTKD
jgi:hypothetical protein